MLYPIAAFIVFIVGFSVLAVRDNEQLEIAIEWSEWRTFARENQCLESEVSPGFWSCAKPGPGKTYFIVRGPE